MTAKEELRQIYSIRQKIDRLKSQIRTARMDMLTVKSPVVTPDKVQTSMTGDRAVNALAHLMEMEDELAGSIDELISVQKAIVAKIERIDNEEYKTVLFSRYVELKKWGLIAVEMGYDIRHVYRLHGNALIAYAVTKCQ